MPNRLCQEKTDGNAKAKMDANAKGIMDVSTQRDGWNQCAPLETFTVFRVPVTLQQCRNGCRLRSTEDFPYVIRFLMSVMSRFQMWHLRDKGNIFLEMF